MYVLTEHFRGGSDNIVSIGVIVDVSDQKVPLQLKTRLFPKLNTVSFISMCDFTKTTFILFLAVIAKADKSGIVSSEKMSYFFTSDKYDLYFFTVANRGCFG